MGIPCHLGIDFDRIGFNAVLAQEFGRDRLQTKEQRGSSLGIKAGDSRMYRSGRGYRSKYLPSLSRASRSFSLKIPHACRMTL